MCYRDGRFITFLLDGRSNMKDLRQKTLLKLTATILIACCICASASAASRFVVCGDTRGDNNGVNTTILAEIVAATIAEGADFILMPGDLVNGSGTQSVLESQLTTWRNTMQPLYDAGVGVYPVRGNHDAGNLAAWNSVFSGSYALPANGPTGEVNLTYSFTFDNIFVAAVDQYVNINRVNQTWLDGQFAANTQPHVFVFGHAPAFKVIPKSTAW